MNNRISTKKIALCGVLTALAMIFSYIESVIPIPIPVPGIKLGVANIAVITILYVLGVKEAIVINLLRIALTALLFGNVNSFLFSISGAVLSLTIMIIMKKLDFFSCIGVSVCGGVMHNVGQIIAAVFIRSYKKNDIVICNDGDFRNIRLDNLNIVQKKEYCKGRTTSKNAKVGLFENNELVQSYPSTRKAGSALFLSRQTICDYCNNKVKKPIYDLRWIC